MPLTTVMPNLERKSPKTFSLLQNLHDELEDSVSGELCRTEKKCVFCKRDWGPQSELLGRSYILRKLECQKHGLIRVQQQVDFEQTLSMVPFLLRRSLGGIKTAEQCSIPGIHRICQLLFCLHTDYLLQKGANRLVTKDERILHSAYERFIDETYSDLQKLLPLDAKVELEDKVWRMKGAGHRRISCGDGFIGRQDDPNHEADSGVEHHPSMHTDMFQDDPLKGFIAALSMISNPECLVGYGVFDRVKKPGAIIRCPSQPIDAFLCPSQSERDQQKLMQEAVKLLQEFASIANSTTSRKGRRQQSYFKRINLEYNDHDPDGLSLITFGQGMDINFQTSMAHFLSNVPLPGMGPLLFSSPKALMPSPNGTTDEYSANIELLYTRVLPYSNILFPARSCDKNVNGGQHADPTQPSSTTQNQQNQINGGGQGGNLELNLVWLIARHLGWTVDNEENRGALLIDRRLLIATQWLNNTIMAFSLLASLLSRKFQLITTSPVSVKGTRFGFWQVVYMNLPFQSPIQNMASNQMRFWSKDVCGIAAIIVFAFYFVLGRSAERNIGRSYEHELLDVSIRRPKRRNIGMFDKISCCFFDKMHWLWDCICPLFLQQRSCLSNRNRRPRSEVMDEVIHLRSKFSTEHPEQLFDASQGRGRMNVEVSNRELGICGHLVGLAFFSLSFSACSPHFVINSLTVFCCGLSYGMSLSLESMEIVRSTTSAGLFSVIKPRRLNTHVIGFITIGQLVGSSGGIIFLAEFIVTLLAVLLGGAATVTSSTLESWITFFCLASTALWGFVFARLGLLDGMRKKRRGVPSALLCAALCSAITMWAIVLTSVDWYSVSPGSLVVAQIQGAFTDIRRRQS